MCEGLGLKLDGKFCFDLLNFSCCFKPLAFYMKKFKNPLLLAKERYIRATCDCIIRRSKSSSLLHFELLLQSFKISRTLYGHKNDSLWKCSNANIRNALIKTYYGHNYCSVGYRVYQIYIRYEFFHHNICRTRSNKVLSANLLILSSSH